MKVGTSPAGAYVVNIPLPIAPIVYGVSGTIPSPPGPGSWNLFIYVDSSSTCSATGTDSAGNPICGSAGGDMIYIPLVVMNSSMPIYITLQDGAC